MSTLIGPSSTNLTVYSGTTPEIETIPLRIGEVQGLLPDQTSNNASFSYNAFRREHYLGANLTEIRLVLVNFFVSEPTDSATGNSYTIQEMSLEAPNGTVVPVRFSSSRSVTLNSGDTEVVSDPLYPSDFGLSQFNRGTVFWTKGFITVPSNGNNIPTCSQYKSPSTGGAQAGWYNPASTTLSSTDSPGVYTITGTALTSGGGIRPILIGRSLSDNPDYYPSYFAAGDSLTAGSTDNGLDLIGKGHIARACGNNTGKPYPLLRYCRSGILVTNFSLSSRGSTFSKYANIGICALGTNGMSSVTVAQRKIDLTAVWDKFKTNGINRVYQLDYYAQASSTDNWTTVENQTPPTSAWEIGGTADITQQWFREKVTDGTLFGVINLNYLKAGNGFRWKPNLAFDQTHPNTLGNLLAGSTIRLQLDSHRAYSLNDNGKYSLYIDASDTSTILDSNGTNASSSSFLGTVATILDKSGNSNNLTQSNSTERPTFSSSKKIGNSNIPYFDGSNDSLVIPSGTFSFDSDTRDSTVILIYFPDDTNLNNVLASDGTSGSFTSFSCANQSQRLGGTLIQKSTPVAGFPVIQVCRSLSGTQRLKINNDSEISGSSTRNGMGSNFTLGRYPAGTCFTGGIGLVINYNCYIPGPQLNKIVRELILTGPFGNYLFWTDVEY